MVKENGGNKIWVKHGKGIQQWNSGAIYEGYWHEGKMQGKGKFIHTS